MEADAAAPVTAATSSLDEVATLPAEAKLKNKDDCLSGLFLAFANFTKERRTATAVLRDTIPPEESYFEAMLQHGLELFHALHKTEKIHDIDKILDYLLPKIQERIVVVDAEKEPAATITPGPTESKMDSNSTNASTQTTNNAVASTPENKIQLSKNELGDISNVFFYQRMNLLTQHDQKAIPAAYTSGLFRRLQMRSILIAGTTQEFIRGEIEKIYKNIILLLDLFLLALQQHTENKRIPKYTFPTLFDNYFVDCLNQPQFNIFFDLENLIRSVKENTLFTDTKVENDLTVLTDLLKKYNQDYGQFPMTSVLLQELGADTVKLINNTIQQQVCIFPSTTMGENHHDIYQEAKHYNEKWFGQPLFRLSDTKATRQGKTLGAILLGILAAIIMIVLLAAIACLIAHFGYAVSMTKCVSALWSQTEGGAAINATIYSFAPGALFVAGMFGKSNLLYSSRLNNPIGQAVTALGKTICELPSVAAAEKAKQLIR